MLPMAATARRRLTSDESASSRSVALTRLDYARSTSRAGAEPEIDILLVLPHRAAITMRASYAADLLELLRDGRRPGEGRPTEISVDCPVRITISAGATEDLIAELEGEERRAAIASAPAGPRRRRRTSKE